MNTITTLVLSIVLLIISYIGFGALKRYKEEVDMPGFLNVSTILFAISMLFATVNICVSIKTMIYGGI